MDGLIDMRFDQEAKLGNVHQCQCFPVKGSTLIIVILTLIPPLKKGIVQAIKKSVFLRHQIDKSCFSYHLLGLKRF